MDWKTCVSDKNAVSITPDRKRALFLIEKAEKTLKVLEKIKIDDENASVFFSNYYNALLETLHAIMYSKGYKVKNYYCLGYYLRDVMNNHKAFDIFDRARLVRNSIIYYGEDFEKEVATDMIKEVISIINDLKKDVKQHGS